MSTTVKGYTIAPGANLYKANLGGTDLGGANLCSTNLSEADLGGANLRKADLSNADLSWADLSAVVLYRANLRGADLCNADLSGADLRSVNLSGADLSGANLRGADLSEAKGLGSKEGEIRFAKQLHDRIRKNPECFNMDDWHCGTTHCIAGHAFPDLEFPGQPASLLYPTLAQYFFASNEEAIAALERVARGEESVFS